MVYENYFYYIKSISISVYSLQEPYLIFPP